MSQTESSQQRRSEGEGGSKVPARHSGGATELRTEQGVTSIDESVVAKIAAIAAREVEGVERLGGTVTGALSNVVGRIRGGEHRTTGVGVEVGERQAAADLTLIVRYPAPIAQVTENVRQNVIDRVESLTGLEVVEVNIAVTDLAFEDSESEQGGQERRVE